MAVKEIKMSEAIAEVAANFNENNNWVRVYFNEDNGFIWWEDQFTCPKANHITYNNNPNIVVLFEKGNPEKPGNPSAITGDDIVKEANARLA
ncbi:MAG: hypothetical protein HFJ84_09405 [Clostridiales bacterium]|nr:hypothetical protein [Clostridiales bacterium]